jgi:hypothetical protein
MLTFRESSDKEGGVVFARCETSWWFDWVWPKAAALLLLQGRVTFLYPDDTKSPQGHNSGGPSVLVAYGDEDAALLEASGIPGCLVRDFAPLRAQAVTQGDQG